MKTTLLLVSLLALFPGPGAAQTPSAPPSPKPLPSVTLPPELGRVLTDYEAAWSKKDPAALSRLFAEDGFVLAQGSPPVRGRSAIEAFYTGHGGPLSLRAIAYAQEGRTGYILGAYSGKAGGADDGKFTLTVRKSDDGRWLIVSDMDNSIRKAPAAEPAAEAGLGARPGPFVALSVANIEASVAFYRDVLGFKVYSQGVSPEGGPHPGVHFALLQQDNSLLEILQLPDAKPRKEAAPGSPEASQIHGFFKSGFVVQDLDGLYQRVKAKKIPLAFELGQPPGGPYRVFGVRDPEGNLLQFFGR